MNEPEEISDYGDMSPQSERDTQSDIKPTP